MIRLNIMTVLNALNPTLYNEFLKNEKSTEKTSENKNSIKININSNSSLFLTNINNDTNDIIKIILIDINYPAVHGVITATMTHEEILYLVDDFNTARALNMLLDDI